MSKCSGCGCPLPWPLKTCNDCAVQFFNEVYTPAAQQPVSKLCHCTRCTKLAVSVEQGSEWLCPRCQRVPQQVKTEIPQVDAPSAPVRVQLTDTVAVAIHPKQTEQKVQKVDKPTASHKPSLLRWFDSDMRQRILAYRIQECLEAAGGRIGLRLLKQRLHASRYYDWQAAFDWLAGAGVLEVQGKDVVLIKPVTLRLPPRRRKPRRKQIDRPRRAPSEWFERHREMYGEHWKTDPELRA